MLSVPLLLMIVSRNYEVEEGNDIYDVASVGRRTLLPLPLDGTGWILILSTAPLWDDGPQLSVAQLHTLRYRLMQVTEHAK